MGLNKTTPLLQYSGFALFRYSKEHANPHDHQQHSKGPAETVGSGFVGQLSSPLSQEDAGNAGQNPARGVYETQGIGGEMGVAKAIEDVPTRADKRSEENESNGNTHSPVDGDTQKSNHQGNRDYPTAHGEEAGKNSYQ